MNLPYHMSCPEMEAGLFQLQDRRFQMITKGKVTPLMVGFDYALAEKDFADYLERLDLPKFETAEAVIYDPIDKQNILTHRRLRIGEHFSGDMIRDINLDDERILLMDNWYLFVSQKLKSRLEDSDFNYLRFSLGLSEFAG